MYAEPYSQLARVYDKVMAHVNYKMWTEYIRSLYKFSDTKIDKVIDLSCGTGKHIQLLKKDVSFVVGADYSRQMLLAAKKNCSLNKHFYLIGNDARAIAVKNQTFDAVLMLYDSINYLLKASDVEELLKDVSRILIPGGIFIFDVVTENGLEECFNGYYESDSWQGIAYERHSSYSKKTKLQYNKFNFLFNGTPFIEEHRQRIRTPQEWKEFIKKSKMHLCAEFSNFSLSKPNRKSMRIHFVCKKN